LTNSYSVADNELTKQCLYLVVWYNVEVRPINVLLTYLLTYLQLQKYRLARKRKFNFGLLPSRDCKQSRTL